jgi:hypothetical protein
MVETKQVNVRVPPAAADLLLTIAERLRKEPNFAVRLKAWEREQGDPSDGSILSERVTRIESRLAALEQGRGSAQNMSPAPIKPARNWTTGKGQGRRLSQDGEKELRCLIRARWTDADIARALGVRPNTVANRRKRISGE